MRVSNTRHIMMKMKNKNKTVTPALDNNTANLWFQRFRNSLRFFAHFKKANPARLHAMLPCRRAPSLGLTLSSHEDHTCKTHPAHCSFPKQDHCHVLCIYSAHSPLGT
jgi:hypothetical protein